MTETSYNAKIRFGEDGSGNAFYFYGNPVVREVQSTIKQVIGKTIVEKQAVGRDSFERRITVEGFIKGSSKDTDRETLRNLMDMKKHTYNDGKHTGNFIIKPPINWDDNPINTESYGFTITLLEVVQ